MATYKFSDGASAVSLPPEGWYLVRIVDGKTSLTKKQNIEVWKLRMEILFCAEKSFIGRIITDQFFFMEGVEFKDRKDEFFAALYPQLVNSNKEISCEAEDQEGKELWVRIGHAKTKENDGEERIEVRVYERRAKDKGPKSLMDQLASSQSDDPLEGI